MRPRGHEGARSSGRPSRGSAGRSCRRAGPSPPYRRVTSEPSDRAHDAVGVADRQLGADLLAALQGRLRRAGSASWRRATPRVCAPGRSGRSGPPSRGTDGRCRIRQKSRLRAFQWSIARRISRRSLRPTISSTVRKPSCAMCSRTSCATKRMKLTTCCGSPVKRLRSSGSWVATPDGAGVEMADAHHHAAQRDQRRGGEAELLGAQQRGDDHVAAGLQLAVHLQRHARPQVVQQQRLVGLGEAQLPGQARVLDARRGARRPCRRRGR